MAENTESVRDELTKLAEITNLLDETVTIKKGFTGVIELENEDFLKFLSMFREVDRKSKKFVIQISGYDFTFVLKK
jgi:hypothetical protein